MFRLKQETDCCPLGHINSYFPRPGTVRDAPHVGLVECAECGIVSHSVDLKLNVNYAEGTMHARESDIGEGLNYPASDVSRRVELLKNVLGGKPTGYVLDLGCGDGQMILSFQRDGLNALGVEPGPARARAVARDLKVVDELDSLSQLGVQFSDIVAVTMFHVMEHIYNPLEFLKDLHSRMPEGCSLIIETPSSQDALLVKFECEAFQNFTYWSHHPYLYSPKALEQILSMAGFSQVSVEGAQRYGLANHLLWLSKSRPGGHDVWANLWSAESELSYSKDLAKLELSDTLVATCVKK
jgi:SAM-dependent methyltransferase